MLKRKLLSVILVFAMLLSLAPARLFALAEDTPYQGDGFEVRYELTSGTQGAYNVSCTIRNTGSAAIENWAIGFNFTHSISSIWSAEVASSDNGYVIIKNGGWNANIAPNATATFGFTAKSNEQPIFPAAFDMCEWTQIRAPGASAEFKLGSTWGTGFSGTVTIKNTGTKPIKGWMVSFNFSQPLTDAWSGVLTGQSPYTVRDAGWNANIPAGGSVAFQIQGTAAGGNYTMSDTEVFTFGFALEEPPEPPEPDSGHLIVLKTLAYNIEGGFYIANDAVYQLEGTVNGGFTVADIRYTHTSHHGTAEGSLIAGRDWAIPDILLGYGVNIITFDITDTGGETRSADVVILNYNTERLDGGDDDGDGLSNWAESYLGTDKNNPDTDSDGLGDGLEASVLLSDPLTPDGWLDFDGDGLTNYEEAVSYQTNPALADTDGDGLTDYEELMTLGTDPLKADTDGDGVTDSDELLLGLDPWNPVTDGITPDAERVFTTTLSRGQMPASVFEGSEAVPALTVNVAGVADNEVRVSESEGSTIEENPAIIGKSIHIALSDKVEGGELSFELEQPRPLNELMICRLDPDTLELAALETSLGENGVFSAELSGSGDYFMLDIKEFFAYLGLDIDDILAEQTNQTPQGAQGTPQRSRQASLEIPADFSECKNESLPADIVQMPKTRSFSRETTVTVTFVIDTTKSMATRREFITEQICQVIDRLKADYNIDAYYAIAGYGGDLNWEVSRYWRSEIFGSWYPQKELMVQALDSLVWGENPNDLGKPNYAMTWLLGYYNDFRAQYQHMVLITDEDYQKDPSMYTYGNALDTCEFNNVALSAVVLDTGKYSYEYGIARTGGIVADLNKPFADELYQVLSNPVEKVSYFEKVWITLKGGKRVQLLQYPDFSDMVTDTDEDDLADSTELTGSTETFDLTAFVLHYGQIVGTHIVSVGIPVYDYTSDPTMVDTDSDGLEDGRAQYVNGVKVVPKDPEPRKANGPRGIWQEQLRKEKTIAMPTKIGKWYGGADSDPLVDLSQIRQSLSDVPILRDVPFPDSITTGTARKAVIAVQPPEWLVKTITKYNYVSLLPWERIHWKDINAQLDKGRHMTAPGSWFLNFKLDDKNMGIHSQNETWQKPGGYNDTYDLIFQGAMDDNMDRNKLEFTDSSGNRYVLWLWRGDYLNLGSGAEMGIYDRPNKFLLTGAEHWQSIEFTLPMTLNLYNSLGSSKYQHVFSWKPVEPQWWITGFNPRSNDPNDTSVNAPNVHEMVMLGSVNFSTHKDGRDMFMSMQETVKNDKKRNLKDFVVFDEEDLTVWIIWWDKETVS